MIVNYFAYGSNMNPERMIARGVEFISRKKAQLNEWKLVFNKKALNGLESYANIVEDPNEQIEGILYEIDEKDIEKLDRYEGYPEHYLRETITAITDDNSEVEAFVYIANPNKTANGLKPSKEYLQHLIKGSDILSEDYRNKIAKTPTL